LFLDYVVRVHGVIDSARQALNEESGKETGTISLGFLPSLGLELVPRLIKEYRRKFPRIKFTLITQLAPQLMAQLSNGNVDLCLSVPGMFDPPGIRWTLLHKNQEIVIVLPQAHRLAQRRSLRLKDLAQETFLTPIPGNTLRTILERACVEAKFVPKIGFEALDHGTLRGMIAAGLGIGMLPRSPARVAGIVEIKLSQPHVVRPLGIGWIEGHYLPPCAAAFRDFVTSSPPSNSR
jgi:DNA-binding transcriptional LysR family regulator